MTRSWWLIALLWTPAALAAKPHAQGLHALVERMQAFYANTRDFRADFTQDYDYRQFNRREQSSGTVLFKKPALMRWNYLQPSPRTFVLDKETIYALDPDAQTLTKAKLQTNQLSASVTFLWGRGKLADEFAISQRPCPKCQGTLLRLKPLHPDARFQEIRLEVDPKTAAVLRSTVIDPDGSENTITFKDLRTNVGLTLEDFKLKPPPGTQLVDLTGSTGK